MNSEFLAEQAKSHEASRRLREEQFQTRYGESSDSFIRAWQMGRIDRSSDNLITLLRALEVEYGP